MVPSQEEIRKAREAFQKDEAIPVNIRKKTIESWIRSRDAGVTPDRVDKTLISAQEIQKRIMACKTFYDTASSVLAGIYRFTVGSGFIAAIFDVEAYVLYVAGDEEIMCMAKANGLVEGCNRSEKNIGTNGIGTAIMIGDAVQISGEEHYFPLHHNWVCSGAPVFDHLGCIIGGLCIIGEMSKAHIHTLGMVAAAAKSTTQLLLMQHAYGNFKRAQQNTNTMLSAWTSSVMIVDKNLRIIQVNNMAARLLGKRIEELENHALNEFIPVDLFNSKDFRTLRDYSITLEIGGKTVWLSLTIQITDAKDYVLFFEKAKALHKRVNHTIGSDARFTLDDIIGYSIPMRKAIRMASIAAQNDANVFLSGECGTGKEMFAQGIHNASKRRDNPFIAINCGAIPKSLIESELFGYEGGSFTGAKQDGCPGKFELANGGTIFLDEIGDMPFDTQVNLLRVLQNREVCRIGSSKTIKIDVRVISATNQNIEEKITNKEFRDDLYYRLNVFDISIPALREHQDDIIPLAEYFLNKYAEKTGIRVQGLSPQTHSVLKSYLWPGNIRELENVIERAIYISSSALIVPQDLSIWNKANEMEQRTPLSVKDKVKMDGFSERERIENLLYFTNFKVKKAAELLGISRRTMYRRMSIYGISKDKVKV